MQHLPDTKKINIVLDFLFGRLRSSRKKGKSEKPTYIFFESLINPQQFSNF